jgi:LmbE family N-acetylglucosaminyl deacetylase
MNLKKDMFLFVGAHPDDIEFGAGATLAKAIRSNIDCHALVLSDCHESLGNTLLDPKTLVLESKSALAVLGLKPENMNFLEFPVRNFPEIRQYILQILIEKAKAHHYSRIYVPSSFDIHQDHHVVHVESLRAFKFSTILGYELPWNSFEGALRNFNVLDAEHVQLKKLALQKFDSQNRRFYSGPENVETALRFRGLQINAQFAEAFEVLRWIEG